MIRYIKRLCTAMLLLLTTLSLAVAVELTLIYLQSGGMLVYAAAALAAMLASIGLCNAVTAALIAELSDIVTERVLQKCGKTAENKLEIY